MINKNTLLKYLGIMGLVILLSSIAVRVFNGGDTLSDYADKNPEIAYAPHAEPENTDPSQAESESTSDSAKEEMSTDSMPNVESDPPQSDSMTNGKSDHTTSNSQTSDSDSIDETDNTISNKQTATETTDKDSVQNINDNLEDNQNPGDNQDMNDTRIVFQEGFYYEPLPDQVKERITGISYKENPDITYDELRYLKVLYYDFQAETQIGEIICNQAIAQDLVEIFYELYQNEYQIEKIELVDEYGGDDTLSMEANNTSCFNYRVVDGTTRLSKHALGLAIDINPYYNPYIVYNKNGTGETYISPKGSEIYADRTQDFPYKIDTNDLCYRLFKEHGFTWGGDWNSTKDYQHFQKVIK